ncbi:MAG: hypothetical protein JSU63_11675 [Phycisphaerales bacterium]|nr:MAG: hypothetical protein JSU63_11675 [Phycisphaerales bacterium]
MWQSRFLRCGAQTGLLCCTVLTVAACGACLAKRDKSAIQPVKPIRLEPFEPARVEPFQPQSAEQDSPADSLVRAERARMAIEDQRRAANALEKIEATPQYRDEPILLRPNR